MTGRDSSSHRSVRLVLVLAALGAAAADLEASTVNSVNDPGDGVCDSVECTLAEAIAAANAAPGADFIEFDIPGPGPHRIVLTGALPVIAEAVEIDGASEPDFGGTPVVEVDGDALPLGRAVLEVGTTGGGTTIRALVIVNGPDDGIRLRTGGNFVEGNLIGTDTAGTPGLGNQSNGVQVEGAGNRIGGTTAGERNVISGNASGGVGILAFATGTMVLGNFIGTDPAGTTALASGTGVSSTSTPPGISSAAKRPERGTSSPETPRSVSTSTATTTSSRGT